MAHRLKHCGQRGAIALAVLLLAGQAALFMHQADHLANAGYQNCVTCLSLHLDDALAAAPVRPANSARHEAPDPAIALPAYHQRPAATRIRSPPCFV